MMELNDFIEKIAEQFEETDKEIFTPETHFKELEDWSSLTALSVIAMIDEEYGISVKSDDLKNAQTVEELFNKLDR